MDIAPTILNLFEIDYDESNTAGRSLLTAARGENVNARERAITKLEIGSAVELAIRVDDWAFLLPVQVPEGDSRESQLYGKPEDRWEVNNVRAAHIERCDEFEQELLKRESK
jgi:arylsulfatase A-like enzyme